MLPAAQLSHLEVALYEGQEMDSTTASQVRLEASNLPHSLSRSSLPAPGSKRRRALSWPESVRKRPSLLAEPAPTPKPFEPLLPEPWWDYFPPPKPPSEVASLDDEVDIDVLKSPSACPTPSQDSDSTESDITQDTSSTSSRKKRERYLEDGMVYVGPKDEKFGTVILHPLGVVFSSSPSLNAKPIDIFGLQLSNPDSNTIIRKSNKELEVIMRDFTVYEAEGYDEHTLCIICYASIVPRDAFIYRSIDDKGPNIRTSVRRDHWKPKKEGPSIPAGASTYDWDIKPGTTYAVSIQMFDVRDRKELARAERQSLLAERAAVCPYLTIEYKCRAANGRRSHARYQNAAASVLWLHQRKQIREALGRTLDDLKHFSITIFDSNYAISEARFKYGYYYVHELMHGDLTDVDGLKCYIEWNNAIHTWGLGPNASSFKEDMVILLERFRGQPNCPPALRNN
ncbi:hypothetical protein JMJ35_007065 [Cladonia borealis]|uniref:Uncharacterized protein n=1 Tax=Cladonia borealis TaxID=184061 RepID=A0AA39QWS7_9LECA|nr:hypothetical protein JMJ35_007065 [Cladonia borealis]